MIKMNDFVILKETIEDIVMNSVGYVREVADSEASVFFIGKLKEITVKLSKIEFIDTSKTGRPKGSSIEYPTKICNVCHILKPIEEFEINQNAVAGRTRRPACRHCRKEINGVALRTSERQRMKLIEPKIFFVCPICKKASIPGVTANLVIDHDHKTGDAREWICDSCNTGLGRFKDDIELLKKTISYLEKNEK